MKNVILQIKIFLKEKILLGKINKFLYGPKKKLIPPFAEKAITIFEVIPETQSLETIDHDLLKLSNAADMFLYSPGKKIDPVYIAEINNGRLMVDITSDTAVMNSEGFIVDKFSMQYSTKSGTNGNPGYFGNPEYFSNSLYRQKYYYPPLKLKGTVLNLNIGSGAYLYFHFLYESLPCYHLAEKLKLINDIDYFYLLTAENKFHKEIITALGIGEEKIITSDKYPHIKADRLITSTHPNVRYNTPKWILDFLRTKFVPLIIPDFDQYSKFYISRSDAKKGRRIINEDALFDRLRDLGFKKIILSDYSFLEQVKIFNSAKIIVAAHGSGLANIAFCNPHVKIIEIFSSKFVEPTYHCISNILKIKYDYIIANDVVDNCPSGYFDIYIDDIELLIKKIRQN